MKKTAIDITKEYFPNESNEFLEYIIWDETGYPGFFNPKKNQTIEDCFRKQLLIAQKKRYNVIKRFWIGCVTVWRNNEFFRKKESM